MNLRFTGLTDTGVVRTVNQDNFYVDDPKGRFFIVADGMGGHAGGQEASFIATTQIRSYLDTFWGSDLPTDELLTKALELANQKILEDQHSHPERGDMGTTAVVVVFRKEEAWSAHIGDSRLYRLRNDQLKQITEDHTWVAKAMRAGDLSTDQARSHPWRHVLSQCLGRRDLCQIEVQSFEVLPGDRLLLCSDGLTEEVPDELILATLLENIKCDQAAEELIDKAKKAGGSDNITVILVAQD